jgi:hypothetical protein
MLEKNHGSLFDLKQFKVKKLKYRNIIVVVDNIRFASKKEAKYYCELKLRLQAGEIIAFERQKPFSLDVNDKHICKYLADFIVLYKSGKVEIIDVKGFRTEEYKLKKKLFEAIYNQEIIEK